MILLLCTICSYSLYGFHLKEQPCVIDNYNRLAFFIIIQYTNTRPCVNDSNVRWLTSKNSRAQQFFGLNLHPYVVPFGINTNCCLLKHSIDMRLCPYLRIQPVIIVIWLACARLINARSDFTFIKHKLFIKYIQWSEREKPHTLIIGVHVETLEPQSFVDWVIQTISATFIIFHQLNHIYLHKICAA